MKITNTPTEVKWESRWVKVLVTGVGIFFALMFVVTLFPGGGSSSVSPNGSVNVVAKEESIIQYEVLRNWQPNKDSNAIGLEILIKPSDLSEKNIVDLAKEFSNRSNTVVVKVYTSKEAWDAGKSEDYSSVWKGGYIAFYMKRGNVNEVRWMQEVGKLSSLFGKKAQIK
ncbi:hypothetical protein CL644_01910 [bacterium]|nr:hypothetical protein [bacterium]|tara:strand:- start:1724 stop:2230 length:507 start_codon:yes stop_codon:yes gene_type:complete